MPIKKLFCVSSYYSVLKQIQVVRQYCTSLYQLTQWVGTGSHPTLFKIKIFLHKKPDLLVAKQKPLQAGQARFLCRDSDLALSNV